MPNHAENELVIRVTDLWRGRQHSGRAGRRLPRLALQSRKAVKATGTATLTVCAKERVP